MVPVTPPAVPPGYAALPDQASSQVGGPTAAIRRRSDGVSGATALHSATDRLMDIRAAPSTTAGSAGDSPWLTTIRLPAVRLALATAGELHASSTTSSCASTVAPA